MRPKPVLGAQCAELRIRDVTATWRILYRPDTDAVIIAAVFAKKTPATLVATLATAKARLCKYHHVTHGDE